MIRGRAVVPRVVLAASFVLVAGCGGGASDGRFDATVAEVRAAVDAGDHDRASGALDALALEAVAAEQDGAIDDAELAEVTQLVASSRQLVDELVDEGAETAPTTEATPTTVTEPVERDDGEGDGDDDEKDDDEGDEKGKGKKDD